MMFVSEFKQMDIGLSQKLINIAEFVWVQLAWTFVDIQWKWPSDELIQVGLIIIVLRDVDSIQHTLVWSV